MTTRSHNNAALAIEKTLPEKSQCKENFTDVERAARKVLRLVPQKEISTRMEISEAAVSLWNSNARPIPAERMFEIVIAGKLFCKEIHSLENEIDLAFITNFGTQTRGDE